MYFEDEFEKSFVMQEELMRFLKAWEDGAAWIKAEVADIQVLPMTEETCVGIETERTAGQIFFTAC